ncbi:MAG: ribonuclease HII [Flavobacteriaceae bacterium]|jgi:ribonuclease HII|nr:ribonuclease HII [Flavobacteriaceae bacterium]
MLSRYFIENCLEAGTDEAGRGCIAGPVTAAAVILSENFTNNLLTDSKLLSEKNRLALRSIIISEALAYSVSNIEPLIIDEINILNASLKAMQETILNLNKIPQHIIVDGNRPLISKGSHSNTIGRIFTTEELDLIKSIPSTSIVKGDSKYLSIAAASVLAKTYRDDYMDLIHEEFPMYNWKQNKGYPTKEHRAAILKYGVTKYHRMSFRLLEDKR